MAEIKEVYSPKVYPEEAKVKLEKLLEETKETRQILDKLDIDVSSTASPTIETLKSWGRLAIGHGNYLRKKLAKIRSAKVNEEGNRCMDIKIECSKKGITYSDSATKTEASAYVAPLRTVRDIFEAYVISADNIISVCRMCLFESQKEQNNPVDL